MFNTIVSTITLILVIMLLIYIKELRDEIKEQYNEIKETLLENYKLTLAINDLKVIKVKDKSENKDTTFKDFLAGIREEAKEEYFYEDQGYRTIPGMENMTPDEALKHYEKLTK